SIFATKTMDVRLRPEYVAQLDANIENGDYFSQSFLTSRSMEDTRWIMEKSGVKHADLLTIGADSGGTRRIKGVETRAPLSKEEASFLKSIGPETLPAIVQAA